MLVEVAGGADPQATYVVQTASHKPANAQVLASLSTGIIKVEATTGLLTTASPVTDYVAPGGSGSSLTGITPGQVGALPATAPAISAGGFSFNLTSGALLVGQGTGVPAAVALGTNLSITGGVLNAAGGSGAALNVANTWTARQTFQAPNATTIGQVVQTAASPTASAHEWWDSSGAAQVTLVTPGVVGSYTNAPVLTLYGYNQTINVQMYGLIGTACGFSANTGAVSLIHSINTGNQPYVYAIYAGVSAGFAFNPMGGLFGSGLGNSILAKSGDNTTALGGSTWQWSNIFGVMLTAGSGPTSARPSSPAFGSQWNDTSLGIPIWWWGTDWVDAAGAPV